jgi:hypothetical protein
MHVTFFTAFTWKIVNWSHLSSNLESNLLPHVLQPKYSATFYCHLVSSLFYLIHTYLDISFVVGLVARYMQTPHERHWKATKMIVRYIQGTIQFMIYYNWRGTRLLVGFTDSNWVGGPNDWKYTVGYVFSVSSRFFSWDCKRKHALPLSSTKVEYQVSISASQGSLCLRHMLLDFGFQQHHTSTL